MGAQFADRYDKQGQTSLGLTEQGANVSRRAESIDENDRMGAPYVCLKFSYQICSLPVKAAGEGTVPLWMLLGRYRFHLPDASLLVLPDFSAGAELVWSFLLSFHSSVYLVSLFPVVCCIIMQSRSDSVSAGFLPARNRHVRSLQAMSCDCLIMTFDFDLILGLLFYFLGH